MLDDVGEEGGGKGLLQKRRIRFLQKGQRGKNTAKFVQLLRKRGEMEREGGGEGYFTNFKEKRREKKGGNLYFIHLLAKS